ncbi:MAG: PQQ-binding-like beta-propeller repeat protein [Opitutales bacterium]
MKDSLNRTLLPLAILVLSVAPNLIFAGDSWTNWRGPTQNGTVPGAKPPTEWSEDKNVKWKVKVPGSGLATPIVWKDRIFLLSAIEQAPKVSDQENAPKPPPVVEPPRPRGGNVANSNGDRPRRPNRGGPGGRGGPRGQGGPGPQKEHAFQILALHRDSGEVIWSQTARKETPHEGHHPTHGFASGSPVTDGQHLWASFGSRGIFCYDLNGAVVWENDLGNLRTRNGFGEGASPVIAGNSLLVLWDQEAQSYLIALDKKTGKELWRTERDEPTSWTTPVVVEVDGISQAIVAGANKTRSYDTQNGQLIWEAAGLTANIIPTPVVDDEFVYVVSGYKGRSVQAIDLGSKGDVTDSASIAWSALHSAPYVASPVLSGNRLFMNKGNDAYLTCFNAQTGEVFFQNEALEGIRGIYASPISANGHLYVLGKEGVSLVLKDSETFEIVSTNQLDDPIDASPVIVGNDLLIRTHTHLYCISEDS